MPTDNFPRNNCAAGLPNDLPPTFTLQQHAFAYLTPLLHIALHPSLFMKGPQFSAAVYMYLSQMASIPVERCYGHARCVSASVLC